MPIYRLPVTITDPRAGVCTNVWHVRTVGSGGGATSDLQGAATSLRSFYNSMVGFWPVGNSITADFAVDVQAASDAPVTWAAIAGTGAGNVAPPHLAVCITWKTSIRARRGRGRTFLGPMVGALIGPDGTITDANLTTLRTAAQNLINDSLVDNGWAISIWGQETAAPKGFTGDRADLPHVGRDIQSYSIADKWAVMRSRRP